MRRVFDEASPVAKFFMFVMVALCVIGLALIGVIGRLDDKIDKVSGGTSPGATQAAILSGQARAKVLFNTCAKGPQALDPVKVRDFDIVCAPYGSLACAYE